MPIDATTDEQIQACFDVMVQLRPHLLRETFVSTVRAMQSSGYRLAYTEAAGRVVAVAGYRIQANLAVGRHLYIDDLVTTGGQRSQGAGTELIAWLQDRARNVAVPISFTSPTASRSRTTISTRVWMPAPETARRPVRRGRVTGPAVTDRAKA